MSLRARVPTTAALAFAIVLCGSVREARADYLFIPFLGGTFAGRTAFFTGREEGVGSQRLTFGGSVGWLSSGLLGLEGDFSYTPGMFQQDAERAIPEGIIIDSSVMTLSGSVIVAVPQSLTGYSLRPYLVGGVGLIQTDFSYDLLDTVDDNSLGFNVGGGAIGFLTPRTGVRFELRHFRTFDRELNELSEEVLPRLSFWRFTVGVVIRR